jgi:hypothetical protein
VAQHGHARLVARPPLDLLRQRRADAALGQAHVPELVDVARRPAPLELVSLRDDDDGEVLAPLVPVPDVLARLVDRDGLLGMRITSAPPAMPLITAIHPVCRPITSTTMTRLCDSAVVCSRSIASVAIETAVSKPNV